MLRFIVRRCISVVLVLIAISILTFLIFQAIPNGDPALRLAGRLATPQTVESVRKQWGFDKPIYVQYEKTMEKVLTGKVISYTQQLNVVDEIKRGLPVTLSLAIGAGIIWLGLGILFGLLSAMSAGGFLDRSLTVLALIGVSTPVFLIGALMLYYLGYKAQIFPLGGYVKFTDSPWGWFTHMLMPWFALSVLFIGVYSRVLRSTILDTINEDYVRAARAKGITERRVMVRHVLRNSLIPVITFLGADLGALMAGAIVTEGIFNINGVGGTLYKAIQQGQGPTIVSITTVLVIVYILANLVVDLLYAVLDPRIRYA
jgi:peptide/nickel transport system permease protein